MPRIDRRHLLAGTSSLFVSAAMARAAEPAPAKPLSGKTFLITGTSSGFGNLGALHYARQGAKVFATMRNTPRPEADALLAKAREESLDIQVLTLDVLSDEQVAAAVAEAERINGAPLDVLVNNAAIVIDGPVEVHDIEAMKLAFDTNVLGYQRMARAVLPGMRSRKSGLIVNISSQVGRVVVPGLGLYSATKFAVESMSEQLAYELAPHGIDVLIIQPGGYPTEVGENRFRYSSAVADRADPRHTAGYPEMVAQMKSAPQPRSLSNLDPMDVPRAIAEVAAMPAGTRPLRRPVHPRPKPQAEINRVSREAQLAMLGEGPFGPWVKAVLD